MGDPELADIEQAEGYGGLALQGLRLLVPRGAIRSLELAIDMLPASAEHPGSVGQLDLEEQVWPLYALSADLVPLPERPGDYRIAVLMQQGERAYGLLCERFQNIERGLVAPRPVPPAMRVQESPLLGLALCGGEVLALSSAAALGRALPDAADPGRRLP
jgi:hypothetical protein